MMADFRSVKLQKLDTIIRSLAERSQALDGMLPASDAAHKQIIMLEQQVCESIAQDLAALMQQVSLGDSKRQAASMPQAPPVVAPPAPAQAAVPKRLQQQHQQQQQQQNHAAAPNYEGMSKAKADREKRKQNPAHREKEKARKAANMERKIAERKARAAQEAQGQ
ncbi:hypothetical protein DUNSADRAFT_4638 [Dunaliella salina]|uniref:BZIP domain-containing protein n=1 Tax=Dunaliella salina TaxID=3046 RepID=A0ABQ7GRL0_DUNSA|nr:hypothetical protein DUNSADRAFT_4638 [Dunaliella salina]|eukprot:KAF5837247.1 hypothetical protein DUNSADRAFT_4638 [Dunaliella salina]